MTKTDKMSSYGLYLQSLRVEKGISIEQVAAETRIRAEILRAIEAEDHDNLPDDVFVKGFLQSFAKVIEADPNEVLRRFEMRRKAQAPIQVLPSVEPPRQGRFWLTLLWVAVLMACLVGGTFLVYQLVYQGGGTDAHQPQATPEAEVAEPAAQPTPEAVEPKSAQPEEAKTEAPQPKATPETAATPPASVEEAPQENAAGTEAARYKLEIVCHEDTWLKVIVDDAPAEEYFLKPGDRLQLTAKSNYNLLIGNAGGVSVQLDGQPVPVPGKTGEVVNLQLP
jgi:cytoskeleton protein RodZ